MRNSKKTKYKINKCRWRRSRKKLFNKKILLRKFHEWLYNNNRNRLWSEESTFSDILVTIRIFDLSGDDDYKEVKNSLLLRSEY